MDEYLGEITLAHFGRPVLRNRIILPLEKIEHTDSDLHIRFLRACNSAEFREYYFRDGRVELLNYCDYKHIIINCEPAVFFHMIREFHWNNSFLQIKVYDYRGDIGIIFDFGIQAWDINNHSIDEYFPEKPVFINILRKLGFTIFDCFEGKIAELIIK